MAKGTKPPSTLREYVDSAVEIRERRGVCYTCFLAYNGVKVNAKCPNCGKVIKTEERCISKIITGSWIKLSDFRSDSHLS